MNDGGARRRAGLTLLGVLTAGISVVVAVVAVLISHHVTRPVTRAPRVSAVPTTTAAAAGAEADQIALATRPMLQLPAQAAQPQVLTTQAAGPRIAVPTPQVTAGQWIPRGFPDTAEGALGQLKVLDETGLAGADPQVYARGYQELSQPGAPDPTGTGLYSLLQTIRSRAELSANGPVAGLIATYEATQGQIKGTASGGGYVVVCVLGQLTVSYQGRIASAGVGDCQAMRRDGSGWRIAPGVLAAAAPSAWPGSADAVKAGYRELSL